VVSHTFHEFWSRSLRRVIQRTSQSGNCRWLRRSIWRIRCNRFRVKFLNYRWSGKISVAWTFKISSQCSECWRSSPNTDALRAEGHASGALGFILCSTPSWIDGCSSFRFLKTHENQLSSIIYVNTCSARVSIIYVNMVSHITTGKRTYANIQKKGGSVEIYVAMQNKTEEITGNSHKKKGLVFACLVDMRSNYEQ